MRIFVCTFAVALMSVGCAQGGDSTHKELAAIQQELLRMRAENAILAARLDALETTRARQQTAETKASPAASANDDRPPLDVLRLAPTAQPSTTTDKPHAASPHDPSASNEVDPDEPRPVLRSTGRGEVVAQSPRPSKPPAPPRPVTTASGTPR